jgi:hypothetical protein
MTPDRAREIVNAINNRCLFKMGLTEKLPSLAGVSLAQMVEATQIVEAGNAARGAVRGGHTIHMIPAERLIAAVYALENYPADGDAVVLMPLHPNERFWCEHTHKALGIVAITPKDDEGDDE